MIKMLIIIFLSNMAFGAKDCPGDMVLWRQPGNSYSDCVCPTGQSMVTNLLHNHMFKFGRCSESYISTSRTWAKDIDSSLEIWFDANDPLNNNYRPNDGVNLTPIKYTYGVTTNTDDQIWTSKTGDNIAMFYGSYPGTSSTFNYKKNFSSNPKGSSPNYQAILNYNPNSNPVWQYNSYKIGLTYFFVLNYPTSFSQKTTFSSIGNNDIDIDVSFDSSNLIVDYYYLYSGVPTTVKSSANTLVNGNQIVILKIDSTTANIYIQLVNANNTYSTSSYNILSGGAFDFGAPSNNVSYYSVFFDVKNGTVDSNAIMNYNEMLIYGNALSDSQITQIVQKLNQKWQVY